jgi:3-phenylpropionate/cinnamic acid dioxygenase small subunit
MSAEVELRHQVEQFLFQEADCMDRHAYEEWLALWDDELVYRVPCGDGNVPAARLSLINDGRAQLEQRIRRLEGPHAHAQSPRSKLVRVVSNVRIRTCSDTEVVAESRFMLGEARHGAQRLWIGRSVHTLTRRGDRFSIRQKVVWLLDAEASMGNLQFLL